jgi:hypothetical protein
VLFPLWALCYFFRKHAAVTELVEVRSLTTFKKNEETETEMPG